MLDVLDDIGHIRHEIIQICAYTTHLVLDEIQIEHRHLLCLDNILNLQNLQRLDLYESQFVQRLANALRLFDAWRKRTEATAWL